MLGVLYGLTAALFWAIATRFYKQMADYWSPVGLVTVKSIVSSLLFLIWFLVAGINFWSHEVDTLLWVVFSGIIGVGFGDCALFYALYRMGERQTLLVTETAAPLMVIVMGLLILGEQLSPIQTGGVILIIVGVDLVIGLRKGTQHFDLTGVLCGLLAAVCHSVGVLISRVVLTQTEITAEETAFLRLLGAALVLPVWMLIRRESLLPKRRLPFRDIGKLTFAIVLGTFLGILLLQLSIAELPAGIAQTVITTSIIFATVIAFLLGEKTRANQWLGIIIAIAGVSLLLIRFGGAH
jgi:drug/metabolite transporter (DMT)-like permease